MKFDCVIGNPPFQKNTKERKVASNRDLWPRFVKKSIDIVVEDGFVANIHPRKWRKPEADSWNILTDKNMLYLEMHSEADGYKAFGVKTNYDWYILKNTKNKGKTNVIDEEGESKTLDLSRIQFLPNKNFNKVFKLLAKKNEETCEVIYSSSAYEHRKNWVANNKSKEYKYLIIYTINKNGVQYKYSSIRDRGHFGISKVVVNMGRYLYPTIDLDGEYGMSNICFGIKVSNKKEAENIQKAISSNKFKDIVNSCRWMSVQFDWRMVKYFRKDFWKELI